MPQNEHRETVGLVVNCGGGRIYLLAIAPRRYCRSLRDFPNFGFRIAILPAPPVVAVAVAALAAIRRLRRSAMVVGEDEGVEP